MVYRRAEPTDTYGKPAKYSEDGSACEVSKKKGKERKEHVGIWLRMWGSSQRKLCLRLVLSYRDREHEGWRLHGSLFLLPESSRPWLQQSAVQCGLVSRARQRHPQGPRQGTTLPPCPQAHGLCCTAQSDLQKWAVGRAWESPASLFQPGGKTKKEVSSF